MFVEVLQGIKEGWRKGDIRQVPRPLALYYIERGYVKETRRRTESFGDKSLAKTRRKGTKPTTKAET